MSFETEYYYYRVYHPTPILLATPDIRTLSKEFLKMVGKERLIGSISDIETFIKNIKHIKKIISEDLTDKHHFILSDLPNGINLGLVCETLWIEDSETKEILLDWDIGDYLSWLYSNEDNLNQYDKLDRFISVPDITIFEKSFIKDVGIILTSRYHREYISADKIEKFKYNLSFLTPGSAFIDLPIDIKRAPNGTSISFIDDWLIISDADTNETLLVWDLNNGETR